MGNGVRVVRSGGPSGWAPRAVTVSFDDTEDGLLPVGEILLQVSALAPGPEAITLLHGLAGRAMTQAEALQVVELWQPQLAWVTGAEQTAVLRFAGPTPDPQNPPAVLADEFAPNHLAPVLHASADHAWDRVHHARQLSEQFSELGDLLRAGALDAYRVRLILDVLTTLENPKQAAQVQAAVLPVAAGLTPAKLRKRLRTLARQVDPGWTTTMFVKARKTRRVVFSPETDGLVGMHAYLPPVEAVAMAQHLTKAARTGPIDDTDERDHDERMADVLIGAVLGSTPGDPTTPMAPDVTVNVFIPAPLLLGLTDAVDHEQAGQPAETGEAEPSGELEGYGALPAGLIRRLAGDASWRRWVLEPVTGHLLDLGKHRYKPSPELAEYIRARDRYCRYPGCNRTARRGDLDHLQPHDHNDLDRGGSTSATNLAAECRKHHRGKTLGRFTVTGNPNNVLTWTDHHGQTGHTRPHNYNEEL